MKVSDAYQGTYCSVENLPEKPLITTITEAGLDDDVFSKADGARQVYIIVDGIDGKIRVNRENAPKLVEAFGDDLSPWEGQQVALSREIRMVKKQRTWCGVINPVAKGNAKPAKGGKK